MSKTPNFDKAIEEALKDIKPHKRNCRRCKVEFEIFQEDVDFYHKLKTTPPTLCPACRMREKITWRVNILPIFYKKKCSAPGHDEEVITFYRPDNPVKVYDDKYYISDEWDGLEFGRDINKEESFLDQFQKLSQEAPHQTLQRDLSSVNCDYTISGVDSKNAYYTVVPLNAEDVYYGWLNVDSRNCIDCNEIDNCEACYWSIYIRNCHNCDYSLESTDCMDSYFVYDCHNCSRCFMSSNLRNKKYVFKNEQLTKEEYEKKIKEIDFGDLNTIQSLREEFETNLLKKAIHKNVINLKVNNVVGDNVEQCKNGYYVFRSTDGNSQDIRYIWSFDNAKDCLDVYGAAKSELVVNSTGVLEGSEVKGSVMIRYGREVEYSVELTNCDYCFGCIGLRNKKFCILNKQYSEEEYWQKVDEIKTSMLKEGSYGEFFPESFSPLPYEDTAANIYYPKDGVNKDFDFKVDLNKDRKNIKDITEDVIQEVQTCEETGKNFKITPFEFNFYKAKNVPIPVLHPLERAKQRAKYQRPFKLWDVKCNNCDQITKTVHDPKKEYIIYCKKCYLKEVL